MHNSSKLLFSLNSGQTIVQKYAVKQHHFTLFSILSHFLALGQHGENIPTQ